MSWNSPQTLTEALKSIRAGFNFQSKTGVTAENVWVLSDLSRTYTKPDVFAADLIERNRVSRERYMTEHTRRTEPQDVVYVVGRDRIALVALLKDGTIVQNDRELSKPHASFQARAVEVLKEHIKDNGHLIRDEN